MNDHTGKIKREASILERRRQCPARHCCHALRSAGRAGPLCPACDLVRVYTRNVYRVPLLDFLEGEEGPFFGC
jgi:hypothetical protein